MASCSTYVEFFIYIVLLFFFIPIKIKNPSHLEKQFEDYLKKFNKSYNNETIYFMKLQAFEKSLNEINSLNSNRTNDSSSALFGLTKFSDMTEAEFLQILNQKPNNSNFYNNLQKTVYLNRNKRNINVDKLPKKIDWRINNTVTKIRNQLTCGACWAFSVIETIESMRAIKYKKLEKLSIQQMIDCAGYNNNGCDGGDICNLLKWLQDNKIEIKSEADYPLNLEHKNNCKMQNNSTKTEIRIDKFNCENFVDDENIILYLLAMNGPLAVAINAKTWQNYVGGVIKYHCDENPEQLNHAVQIVGYDLTANTPYYIVRNSWGEDFGDNGYLYIAVGKNMCGLAHEVAPLLVL